MTKINLCRPPARQGEQERAREGKEGLAMRPDQAHLHSLEDFQGI